MKLRRAILLAALVLFALPLAACGNKEKTTTFAETEGIYVNVGNLSYQVQISRQLNPNDDEDKAYLVDLPFGQEELAPDEAWFAVFVKAWNEGEQVAPAADNFTIVDTQGTEYHPVPIGPDNVFAYRAQDVPGGEQLPSLGTAASNNPSVQGSMLLFRVKYESFDNRPLDLVIRAPEGQEPAKATISLDV